jgi:cytochrome c oxidase subunit 2
MKRAVVISSIVVVLAVVLVILIFSSGSSSNDNGSVSTPGTTNSGSTGNENTGDTGSSDTGTTSGSVKEFNMVAKQWEFVPSTITVNEGDTVKLSITSTDVDHGFALPTFGVNEALAPGETVNVEFVADKKGTYTFFCNVQCGTGHSEMKGTLIVQ